MKYILILIVFFYCYIIAIVIQEGGDFPIEFPNIEPWGSPLGDFSENERIIRSILWYGIVLSVFITIPMYFKKIFKNTKIYKIHKVFWCFASFILGFLTVEFGPVVIGIILGLFTLIITVAPAYYQNRKKINNSD